MSKISWCWIKVKIFEKQVANACDKVLYKELVKNAYLTSYIFAPNIIFSENFIRL